MVKEIILSINKAEEDAANVMAEADREAIAIVERAEAQAEAYLNKGIETATSHNAQRLVSIETELSLKTKASIDQANKDGQNQIKLMEDKLKYAVNFIVERIVNVNGNR